MLPVHDDVHCRESVDVLKKTSGWRVFRVGLVDR